MVSGLLEVPLTAYDPSARLQAGHGIQSSPSSIRQTVPDSHP